MSKGSGTTRSGSSSNPKALAASGAPKSVVVGGGESGRGFGGRLFEGVE